jgi:peptide/nickel transport system substrate-binding protein
LVQNPKFFRGAPILKKVIFRYMPSISSRELGLRTGELDMIEGLMEEKWIEKIITFPDVKAEPFGPTEANMLHINMIKKPFDDLRVRKALSYGINRADVAAFMGSNIAVPIYSSALAPPAIGALTKEEAAENKVLYEANAEEAKRLLKEAGFPNGFKAEVIISEMASSYRKPMIAIQAQLKKVGIDLSVKVVDHSSFHSLIRKDASPLVLYSPWRPNVDVWLTRFYHSNSAVVTGKKPDTNFSHYGTVDADGDGKIDTIDDMIEAARWELDPKKQEELWKQCQIKVLEDVAVVPIMRLKYVFPMKSYVDLGHPNKWMFTTQGTQITEKTKILAH